MDKTLCDEHVKPITLLIKEMRARGLDVPDIDPRDGGVKAKALIFLATPGTQAKIFVSRDNEDPTARNFKSVCQEFDIDRKVTALWNVVPQRLNGDATNRLVREALPDTAAFIRTFENLAAIVFCGDYAKYARKKLILTKPPKLFSTYHTGHLSFIHPSQQSHVRETFRELAAFLRAN